MMTMTPSEVRLLKRELSASRSYLEFGSGASTLMALENPGPVRIDTVESDRSFFQSQVEAHSGIRDALDSGRLHAHFPDIGPTRDWGTPTGTTHRANWPRYSEEVFKEGILFDLVLVDGRFRVACALNALRYCGPGIKVLVHDFTIRHQYWILKRFFWVAEEADTMVLLCPRSDIDPERLTANLRKYSILPEDKTLIFRIFNRLPRKIWEKINLFRTRWRADQSPK